LHCPPRIFFQGDDLFRIPVENFSILCQHDRSAKTIKQLGGKLVFESLDMHADRRLRKMQRLGGL
jgi:hypothetical protein